MTGSPLDDRLSLRKMTFDGIGYNDDWLVIWRGLTIGRILKQSGVAWGQPDWWWGVNFDQRPQAADMRGVGRDLDECKMQFNAAWARIKMSLTEADVEKARRNEEAAERRARRTTF